MEEIDFLREERPIKVWRPIPKNHTKLIVSLTAAGAAILLGTLILWGYGWAIAMGVIMALLTIWIHYMLQKKITINKGYFYMDRNELYLISLAKEDKELRAYLEESEETRNPADPSMLPNAYLMSMANYSVIFHVFSVNSLMIMKENENYDASISYELLSYPYKSIMSFDLQNHYEDFDSLLQVFKDKAKKS